MVKRGRHSLFRPLIAVAICSVILFPLIHPVLPLSAQGPLGERLTGFDINTLPGTGNKSARGVCSDGETLWVVEERALKLFAYSLEGDVPTRDEDGDIQLDFYGNYGPGGCAADESTIWVADDEFDKLIAYDIASKARDGDSDIDTLAAAGNNRVDDVALHGSTVWVADSQDEAVYAYELQGGARVADKDIALHTTEMSPKGLWTDGNTMWVADSLSGHFFAYELAAGTRDTTKEFAASDGTNVQGIWSNGRVLWAANRADGSDQGNKVLAYRMPVSASSDATLSGLSLSGVTLTPVFASGTTAYTASVANTVAETTVTAAASDANASVEVTPEDADDGILGEQVALEVGETTISVEVTAEDGETTQTYTVTVTRAGSSDVSLSALSVSGVTLSPAFASGTTAYTASVGHAVAETTVTATASDTNASVEVTPGDADDGTSGDQVALAVGETTISVEVTAEDGETTQTYTVAVMRTGSADARLSALSLSGVTLSPAFASGTTAYTASVGHAVTETTVTATSSDANASVDVKLNGVVDQDGIVPLAVSAGNVIAVVVTAEDGETTQTYTVTVTRLGSRDATLSALSLSGVTLSPAFASGATAYTASVGHAVTETTVTAMAAAEAGYEVKLNGVVDQDGVVGLAVGSGNVIAVVVTAQNGETTQAYTVTVTRAGSPDATLKALSLSGVTLTPTFASGTTAYTASVANTVTETTVTATASDANASVEVKVDGVVDQDGVVPLAVGDGNVITVVVMAQDGETTQTYTVTLTRVGSGDSSLSSLSLSGVTLTPAFASGTTVYTASVGHAVTETTVTAAAAAGATYEVKFNGVVDQDGVVALGVGAGNVIGAVVTAEDGETTQTYTVIVTRAGSADAGLSALSLSGVTLTPVFAAGTMVYMASVGHAVTETTVTATAAAGAGYEVKLNGVVDQDEIVSLAVGDGNVISVVVTAQDGETTQTYTVIVTRAGSADAGLSALSLSGVTLMPAFASGTTVYTASVGHAVTETTVTATAAAGAGYEVKLNGASDQDGIVPLAVGDGNVITVVVTAQDGDSKQTYTVTVTRAGSGDASLSALSLSGVTLTPAFASGTTAYTASVGHAVAETTVTAMTAVEAGYEVKFNGVVDQDGVVPLAVGDGNVISVVVTAQDGETTTTYTVTVTRAGSGDANLSALSLSGVRLTPAFAPGTTAYTASVGHAVTETTVTAMAAVEAGYEVKFNGVVDQDGVVPLAVGDGNVVSVVVTAQDGETTTTYTVTVTRAGSEDAGLSALSLSGVTLTPAFASGTTVYSASVGNTVTETTVTATAAAGGTYEVKLNGVADQDGIVGLAVGDGNVIVVVVTAQDGKTTQTYTVTVTRAGSGDASLSALSLSGVTLTPAFASGTTTYTASVGHAVAETTVTATSAAGGTYEVKLNGVADQDGIVGLAVGDGNVIVVVVTAQDGKTTQTYTVTVTRAGSGDASLSALSLSGVTLSPAFASGTTVYTASVGHAVAETTVTATAAAGATYEVKLNGVVDQDGIVPLAVGDGNVIAVMVTAQDGETTTTYAVTVTRAGSGDASLSALSLSGVTLSPAFASGTVAYTASVGHAVAETTVTATLTDAGAAYEVKLNWVADLDGVVPLAVGDGNVIALVVAAQDRETTTTYTVTVTRAGSGDANLSALSLSGVTLSPAFTSGTRTYTGSVGYAATETTVTATLADAGAAFEVTLNGVVDQDGVVGLVVGSGNVIAVVVTAQDGVTTRTYSVTVTRAGSADANLGALSLSGVTLSPAFASGVTTYTASVANGVTETTVTATASDANASVEVTPEDADDGTSGDQVALVVGETTISVEVKAEDGVATQTYTVTVTRAGSADASLSALSLSGVKLMPAFGSGKTVYTASVANSVTETTVTAMTAVEAGYEVKFNGVVDQDGVVALGVGAGNVIGVVVTAEDGETTQTYTVTVTRAGSGDASLSALSLSGVTLSPAFTSGKTVYTASVGHAVTETTVTATAVAGAAYVVKLNGVVDQDGIVPLAVGDGNVIAVVVTAQDGETTTTYTVTVNRAGSGDASLSALSLSGVTLTPAFASGTRTYTGSVEYAVTETTVTATATAGAAYEVKLNGVVDQDGTLPLAVGDGNVVAVVVAAQDGETTTTYTVTVNRAGSGDASLSALSLSGVTLSPAFASGTTTYTASVGHAVMETTVTASAAAGAAYEVKLNGVVDQGGIVPLAVGDKNVIAVVVTAQGGETTQTYTVTVTRAGDGDASLSALSLSGVTLSPAFTSGTTAYTASVANSVTETTVTATLADAGAAYEVKLNGVSDQDGIVPLAVGDGNVIAVVVAAQDGETTTTYTVTVTRAGSGDAGLSALSLSGVTLSPAFTSGTTAYTASVANTVTETTVRATAVAGAAYEVKLNGVVDQDGIVPLAVGDGNVIAVVVAAQDGVTTTTYTVTVTRAGSGDAGLSALSLSGVTLTPAFTSGTTAYTASVGHAVTETTVTASAAAGAAYMVKLNGVSDQDGIVPLAVGDGNVIVVVVTAQDGETTTTYTVTVTRAGSGDAGLSALSLSGVTLSPAFSSGRRTYTGSVGHAATETMVAATLADAGAVYMVKLNGVLDQDGVVPLGVGSGNVIAVEVTAQDGVTSQTYTVTVTRAGSADATLSGLWLTGDGGEAVALTPAFASGTTVYAATVAHDLSAVTVTAQSTHSQSSVSITPPDADRGTEGIQVNLVVGVNVITVAVVSQDGSAREEYLVEFARQSEPNVRLKSLNISQVSLSPTFDPTIFLYTATVEHDVHIVAVEALLDDPDPTVDLLLDGEVDRDGVLALPVGASVIEAVVTAKDAAARRTYTVMVTRKAQQLVPLPTPVRPLERESPRPVPSTPTPTPIPTATPRGIGLSTSVVGLEVSSQEQSHPEVTLTAWNRGSGRMILNFSDDAGWLRASPAFVVSTGPRDKQTVTLVADAWLLGSGTHTATVYVSVNELTGPPETVAVTLTIQPGARPTPTPTPTATATPTMTPTPTATATPSPTAAPSPTVAPQPTPNADPASIATVASGRASPSPTPQMSPPAAETFPLPTPAPTPMPPESPSAGLSASVPVLVGSVDVPAHAEGHDYTLDRLGNGDNDAPSQPSERRNATESFAVRTTPITVMYTSTGTIDNGGPLWLILGFFAMDIITTMRRKRNSFLD